jgi:hypothetical protein
MAGAAESVIRGVYYNELAMFSTWNGMPLLGSMYLEKSNRTLQFLAENGPGTPAVVVVGRPIND